MKIVTMLGAAAALASTVSFTPQAWKIIKTAETKDISTGMYLITVTGFALWTSYGIILGEWPLILCNAICFFLAGFILVMKLLPRPKKREVSEAIQERLPGAP